MDFIEKVREKYTKGIISRKVLYKSKDGYSPTMLSYEWQPCYPNDKVIKIIPFARLKTLSDGRILLQTGWTDTHLKKEQLVEDGIYSLASKNRVQRMFLEYMFKWIHEHRGAISKKLYWHVNTITKSICY